MRSPTRRRLGLGALLIAEAMELLDATITQVAAPVIRADLGGPASDIPWFSTAFTLPFTVLLITGGRLGDRLGRKRMFVVGVAGFATASLCCALVATAPQLIALRAVQGAFAALVIPQTIGLIKSMFDGRELARALGSIGPVMGASAICGPLLGALLTRADLLGTSWRTVFLVNLPLVALVLMGSRLLPANAADDPPRLDLVGTVLVAAGLTTVVYPLIESDRLNWPLWSWATMAAGLAALTLFGLHQRFRNRRGASRLIEGSLFGDRGFPAALVASTLFFAAVNGLMLVVVLHIQLSLRLDVLTAGLTLLPWSAAMALASWLVGTRLSRFDGTRVMRGGLALMLGGLLTALAVYTHTPPHAYPWPLLPALALVGLGNGVFTVPFFTTALSRVRPHETGSAAGLLNAVQQCGGTLGIAVLGSVFLRGASPVTACWIGVALLAATGVAAAAIDAR